MAASLRRNANNNRPSRRKLLRKRNAAGSWRPELLETRDLLTAGPGGIFQTNGATELQVWLKPETLSQASGTAVPVWSDSSGWNHHATGAAGTAPTSSATALNGIRGVSFSGSQSMILPTASALGLTNSDFEIFFVMQSTDGGIQFLSASAGANENYEMHLNGAAGLRFIPKAPFDVNARSSDLGPAGVFTTAVATPHILSSRVDFNIDPTGVQTNYGGVARADGIDSSDISGEDVRTAYDNNLVLGRRGTGGLFYVGDMSEVIIFGAALNSAQRVMVENYLSSKYDTTLSAGDMYSGDTVAAGNYDAEVFGIGRVNSANMVTTGSSGGLGFTANNGSLDVDGEFLMAGHQVSGSLGYSALPGGGQRLNRAWFVEKSAGSQIDATLTFDLSDAGLPAPASGQTYRLLYSANSAGPFADTGIGSTVAGDAVAFNLVNAQLPNGYYTLAVAPVPDAINDSFSVQETSSVVGGYSANVLASNPIGYWRLNEGSGPALNSGSGGAALNGAYNNIPAAARNQAPVVPLDSDRSADFNGTNSFIQGSGLNTAPGGNPFAGDWTIEAWLTRDTLTQWGTIFSNNVGSTRGPILTFIDNTNRLGIMGAGVTANNVSIDLGASHLNKPIYAVVTKTGGNATGTAALTVYVNIDGQWLAPSAGTNEGWDLTPSDGFYIGRHWDAGLYFDGKIDEVGVYNRALNWTEIQGRTQRGVLANDVKTPTNGTGAGSYNSEIISDAPIGYWRLGESTGNITAFNSGVAGPALNATYNSAPGFAHSAPSLIVGDTNGAAGFGGIQSPNGDVITGTGLNLAGGNPLANDWTIEAWFTHDELRQWEAIFSNNNGVNGGPIMTFIDNTTQLGINGAGITGDNVSIDLGTAHYGKKVYAVITKQGSNTAGQNLITVYAYVDGVRLTPVTGTTTWNLNPGDGYFIGRHYGGANQLHDGILDEVAIYSKALTAADVERHFQANNYSESPLRVSRAQATDLAGGVATVTTAMGATAIVRADGSFTYQGGAVFDSLSAGQVAGDSFTYTAANASGATDTATVNLTVTGVNDAPELASINVSQSVSEGKLATLSGTFTDPDLNDSHQLLINWGDGTIETRNIAFGDRVFSFTHTYVDDSPSLTGADRYTVTARLVDNHSLTTTNTISYWNFDEAASGTATALDRVDSNNGTFLGGASRTAGLAGLGAANFNHNNGINVGSGTGNNFSVSNGISVEALIKPDAALGTIGFEEIFRKEDGNDRILLSFQNSATILALGLNIGGYAELDMPLDGTNNGLVRVFLDPPASPLAGDIVLRDGAAHHVVGTYDVASGLKAIYIDGVLVMSQQFAPGTAITTGGAAAAYIGASNGGEPFSGVIDEVSVVNRAFNAGEIAIRATNALSGGSPYGFAEAAPMTISVENSVPQIQTLGGTTADENTTYTLVGTFIDFGLANDTYSASFNWGDGSPTETIANLSVTVVNPATGLMQFTATHTYADDNPTGTPQDPATIVVTLTDDDMNIADLVSYWNFDESNGGTVFDLVGGNHGGLGIGTSRVAGLVGTGALSFNDTSNAFVNAGSGVGNNFSTTTGIAVEALIRPTWSGVGYDEIFRKEDGGDRILLAFQSDGNNGSAQPAVSPGATLTFGLNVGGYAELDMPLNVNLNVAYPNNSTASSGAIYLTNPGGVLGANDVVLTDGATHHVVATYDSVSGEKAIWIDGVKRFFVMRPAGTLIVSGGGAAATIGNESPNGGEPFTNIIDEVAFYRRALSGQEVAAHSQDALAGRNYFSDILTITVRNLNPTVNLGAPVVIDEGDTLTRTGTYSDVGLLDTHTGTVNYGAGAVALPLASGNFSLTNTYPQNGNFTIVVTITDDDTGSVTQTLNVTVNNVAPTINAGTNASIGEGSTFTRNGTITDPGVLDTLTGATVDYGDGSGVQPLTVTSGNFNLSHLYNDSGTFTVTLTATDSDGGVGTTSFVITVNNLPPVPNAGADATLGEGVQFTRTGSITDNSPLDTFPSGTVDYGDGTGVQPLSISGSTFQLSHVYADNGTYTVTVNVQDDDGATGTDTLILTVTNAAPTIAVGPGQNVAEGTVVTLTPTTFNDLGTLDTHTAVINWGDTTTSAGIVTETPTGPPGTTSGTNGTVTGTHVYADNGTYTVTVTVTDDDLQSVSQTYTIVVTNANPVVTPRGNITVNEGDTVDLGSSSFNDKGTLDTHTATVNWGVGGPVAATVTETPTGPPGNAAGTTGTLAGTHTYIDNGSFTVNLSVTDDDTGNGTGSFTVTVNNVAPVMDPISGPVVAVPGQPVDFSFSATDVSSADEAAGFTFQIDWDGNGTIDQTVPAQPGQTSITLTHVFPGINTYTVRATATDKDGGVSLIEEYELTTEQFAIDDNGNLLGGGTASSDRVTFQAGRGGLIAKMNNVTYGPFSVVERVIFYAQGGNDIVQMVPNAGLILEAYGGTGNDTLTGAQLEDTLYGQDGDDNLQGGNSNDLLDGGTGKDKIDGSAGDDWIYGGDGNDSISAGVGNDTASGGAGNDSISGLDGDDILRGGNDGDTISGGRGADIIFGNAGNDTLKGDDGNDIIVGGLGVDLMSGGLADDLLIGGDAGGDTAVSLGNRDDDLASDEALTLVLADWNSDFITGMDSFLALGSITFNDGNDKIYGNAGIDVFYSSKAEALDEKSNEDVFTS